MLTILAGGVAWLASHWRAFPPPPPVGKVDPDPLVSLLTWAGPANVLLAAVPLVAGVWGWLVLRAVWPPRVYRLTLANGGGLPVDLGDVDEVDPLKDIEAADEAMRASAIRSQRASRLFIWVAIPLAILGLTLTAISIVGVVYRSPAGNSSDASTERSRRREGL